MVVISNGEKVAGVGPVSLATAKTNSNIEHDATDDYLQLLLDAAVAESESYTGKTLHRRTGVKSAIEYWSKEVLLHTSPVTAITSIIYVDTDGAEQTLPSSEYELAYRDGRDIVRFDKEAFELPELSRDEPYPIEITMTTGYADDDFPADIKQGILLIFSDNELYREDRPMKLGRSSRVKLRPYRINR